MNLEKSCARIGFMNKILLLVAIVSIGVFLILILSNQNNTKPQTPNVVLDTTPTPAIPLDNATPSAKISLSPTIASVSATTGVIKTAKGEIEVEFYPDDAPKTVKNFATLAANGFYDNLTFHRVEPGFVIQGGDPKGDGTGGTSIYGPTFSDELKTTTKSYKAGYKEGVLAMANRGPNTNSSQFFIMLADNTTLPKNYTIFGKVTSGMDVVKQIQKGDKILTIDVE